MVMMMMMMGVHDDGAGMGCSGDEGCISDGGDDVDS